MYTNFVRIWSHCELITSRVHLKKMILLYLSRILFLRSPYHDNTAEGCHSMAVPYNPQEQSSGPNHALTIEQMIPSIFSDFDLYLFGQGRHYHLYDKMGAHPRTV